jgi:uncharacterized protein with ParB-like and HNH nuclease domain
MKEKFDEVDNAIKKVFTEKKDFPLSTIKDLCDDGDIIQPDYQNEFIYDEEKSSRLVESAIMGLPIPAVCLCEEVDGTFSVIDGNQRLTALVRFLRNEYSLEGLEILAQLNGLYYKDLDEKLKKNLKSASLSVIIIKDVSDDLKNEISARLNSKN